jgi:hypothetical protein
MNKPFPGYTKEQAADILRALNTEHLLPGADWPSLLATITEAVTAQTDPVVYQSDATRRFDRFIAALAATEQAYMQLGAGLQLHFDDILPPMGYSPDQLCSALDAARQAAVLAAKQQSAYVYAPTTGKPKDYARRQAVRNLLNIFWQETGDQPIVYFSDHNKERYAGNFYPFAIAALTPVFPKKKLGSIILAAYKEFRTLLTQDQPKKKVKTPR